MGWHTLAEVGALCFVAEGSIVSGTGIAKHGSVLYGMMKADGVFAKMGQVIKGGSTPGYNGYGSKLNSGQQKNIFQIQTNIRMLSIMERIEALCLEQWRIFKNY